MKDNPSFEEEIVLPGSSLSRHLESGVDPGNEVVFSQTLLVSRIVQK